MKRYILDGEGLADARRVYRALAAAFASRLLSGNNPDALWDVLTAYAGVPVELTWPTRRAQPTVSAEISQRLSRCCRRPQPKAW